MATDSPRESGAIAVTLTADPTPVDRTYVTAISVDRAGYTVDDPLHTFGADATRDGDDGPTASFTLTPPNPDGDREADTVTLSAFMGGTRNDLTEPLEIEVADINMLPMADDITASAFAVDEDGEKTADEAMSIVEGGDPVHVTVTVDRGERDYPLDEKLEVGVSADESQALDYRVEPARIEIDSGAGRKSADFRLWALADDDVGTENLVLHLTAKGVKPENGSESVTSLFSITIEDGTVPLIRVRDDARDAIETALGDAPLNPGDEVAIMTDDLFLYEADVVSVSFEASVQGMGVGASASGEAVTLTATEPGEVEVTVTGTATPMADSLLVTQDRADVARLTFPVVVELADLSITLEGPDDPNLVEGTSYKIRALANRAVTEDTLVELFQTDGTASPSDYEVENITILAGETLGSTLLMVNADEMTETLDNAAEMLTLEGRVGAMKTNALRFHLWDAAVPALPVIAQLLLAAFLAVGGYRRYRRRR